MEYNIVYDYIADKILNDINAGVLINSDLARELNKYPIIDQIRNQVQDNHFSAIARLVTDEASSREVRLFALGLLHKYIRNNTFGPQVKSLLYDIWKQGDTEEKFHVMWRLMDFADLEEPLHNEMFEFVKNNKELTLSKTLNWCGSEDKILDYAVSRLHNQSFPEAKAWIYLYIGSLSPNKTEARTLMSKYLDCRQSFVRKVANEMLRKGEL